MIKCFLTFHGETGQELIKCTFKKSRKHVCCRVAFVLCGPKEPLLKQNIHCVPCIPPCDITGLYVLHILSRAKAGFLLTCGVMAGAVLNRVRWQRPRDTLFWFSVKWLWTGTVVLDLQFPSGCVKFLFQLIPPSSRLNCAAQWTVKWT